ncbi:MAG: CBS domain-containing protein [Dokdonella sp.]
MNQVKHLLSEKGDRVYSITPEDSVLDALRMMAEHQIGALLVISGNALVGTISERDYARKVVLMGRASSATKVVDIMADALTTVTPDDTVDRCMGLCTDRRVRHLPVIDAGKVVGVLSIGDLVKSVISQQAEQLRQMEQYISG